MAERTLYRSRTDQMAGGVCAGIAEYFGLDPTVVRLLAVLVTLLTSGGMIVAYIVLWVVVPEEPAVPAQEGALMSDDKTPAPNTPDHSPPPPAPYEPAPPVGQAPAAVQVAPPLPSNPPRPPASRGHGSVWIGLALVFVGGVLLIQMFVPQVRLWEFWPVILIVWGLVVIFRPRVGE